MTELEKIYARNEEILKNLKLHGITVKTVGFDFMYDLLMLTYSQDKAN